jgi:ketosteroid isomerase-like protein
MLIQRLCLLVFVQTLGRSDAWTTARDTSGRIKSFPALLASKDDEGEVPHGYELTTKTKKTLVFDENTGRFFEKSSDDSFFEIPERTAEVAQQEQITSSNFSNEMVPTEILFGTASKEELLAQKKTQIVNEGERTALEKTSSNGGMLTNDKGKTSRSTPTAATKISIVEECYEAWNRRDMKAAIDCFSSTFEYQDSQYFGAFSKKQELLRHFSEQADLLPSDSRIVVENIAVCPNTGNIGTQWHVERKRDGSIVPFTRGCSFYTTNNDGLISSGFRVSEMLVKPSKESAKRLVSSASRLMQNSDTSGMESNNSPKISSSSTVPQSIIEQYFEAWNNRDMKSALECFVDDCVYQTEDPVFVDTFQGKASLREHLLKNAASLPASCRIVLDKVAIDSSNGNIGTRWHLEVNGLQIPNLRGCSMYTTTEAGLLKSGFDVTEAPVKFPKGSTSLLSFPAKLLFRALQ